LHIERESQNFGELSTLKDGWKTRVYFYYIGSSFLPFFLINEEESIMGTGDFITRVECLLGSSRVAAFLADSISKFII
jgi:hypothetical protein